MLSVGNIGSNRRIINARRDISMDKLCSDRSDLRLLVRASFRLRALWPLDKVGYHRAWGWNADAENHLLMGISVFEEFFPLNGDDDG